VPKLISAFENDAGYITAQALDGYAKTADVEAKYATKDSLKDFAKVEELGKKADSEAVTNLQKAVNNIENTYLTQEVAQNTYATTQQVTEQITNVVGTDTSGLKKQVADNTLAIAGKANSSDVYSKSVSDSMFLKKGNDAELGANLQWDSDGKLNTRGIATAEGLKVLEDKVADAVTETELEAKGYQTASDVRAAIAGKADSTTVASDINVALKEAKDYADSKAYNDAALVGRVDTREKAGYQTAQQVQGAITTATADLATKAEVNAKQNKLTAGQNITINGDTISSDIDLSGYALKTDVPSVVGLATSAQLKDLQDTLQEAIDAKQAKGEYLTADSLSEINNAISLLQSGKADASVVTALDGRVGANETAIDALQTADANLNTDLRNYIETLLNK
jgi:hypothetical protein